MKINKSKLRLGIIFASLFLILLTVGFVSSQYYRTQTNYAQYGNTGGLFVGNENLQCEAGQDFILQIAPLGCEPGIVRSDLLEEQNVPVFCQISATQINPLISVEAINSISIVGDYPREVATIGFHPARSAVNPFENSLTQPVVMDNIGYAVITLRQQPNESAIPDVIEGNLTARIRYDVKNAFGIGRNTFYLPVLNDAEWDRNYLQYGFWDGRGYLRAEGVSSNEAVISIYSDQSRQGILSGNSNSKMLQSTTSISVGQSSPQIYIPGFDSCLATMELQLQGVENPDTRARLRIDGELTEVVDNEKFLDNKCEVLDLDKKGFNQEVSLRCVEDGSGRASSTLRVIPKINLEVDGQNISASVGDLLYTNGADRVYLGYAGTDNDTGKEEDLYVYLISVPGTAEKLSDSQIGAAKDYAEGIRSQGDGTLVENFIASVKTIKGIAVGSWAWFVEGDSQDGISYSDEPTIVFGKTINVLGFSDGGDESLSLEIQEEFDNAREDYEEIISSYPDEENPFEQDVTLGENSLHNLINLASDLNQKQTLRNYCQEFRENYPNSRKGLGVCDDALKISSSEISSFEVLIDGKIRRISFEGIYEPSKNEYGAKGIIRYPDGSQEPFDLGKGGIKSLDDGVYIILDSLDDESAVIQTNIEREGFVDSAQGLVSNKVNLDLNEPNGIGNYVITLTEVNLQKVAKVSIIPNIPYSGTEAEFKFRIPVEKRADFLKLSPEKTREKIESLENSIEVVDKVVDNLGTAVELGKLSCLATGGVLTAKNYIENSKGKGIARQEVMRGEGGWYERCASAVGEGYNSEEECLLDKSDEIENEVNTLNNLMQEQNENIQDLQDKHLTGGTFIETKIVDEGAFIGEYSGNVVSLLDSSSVPDSLSDPNNPSGEIVNVAELKQNVLNSEGWSQNTFETEQIRDIELYTKILESSDSTSQMKQTAERRLYNTLLDVQRKSEDYRTLRSASEEYGFSEVVFVESVELKERELSNPDTFDQVQGRNGFSGGGSIDPQSFVVETVDRATNKKYLVVLNDNFVVSQTYEIKGKTLSQANQNNTNPLGLGFKKYDSTSYQNQYGNPEVRYYEAEPYKGEPAIVPFDTDNGWYASVRQTLPVFGGVRGYDESGVVRSYYICNVGQNGQEENLGGDDVCQQINKLSGQTYNQFVGLSSGEALNLVGRAERAIFEVQRQYRNGVRSVNIPGISRPVPVGNPAVDLPELQCQDFMSPKECNVLFNVCDPVICPSSRCDFGGEYAVKDVVQSGVIGSVALCLPNAQEGIVVPVCLTGIHAGLDGFNQVQKSYQSCLQESLDTGQTVGICDEIQSVYMCEFFYRQGVPLAKVGIPKITNLIVSGSFGGSRGGGEYLGVQDAWERASQSVTFFTQYYAENSFNAFKARSVEEAGQDLICQQFISANYPGGDFLGRITEPDSPAQYLGNFEEIPFTTVTNPPISQYKVFYHIYSGNDRGAYYRVYLKGDSGSSFFQDTSLRVDVATGYVAAGDVATATRDLTAPSGYKQLCINVNGQEECGFKQVSTSFALDYIRDSYVAEQVSQTNIKTEAECNSGTVGGDILNVNLQSAAENALNPELYNRGIVRICATGNPGLRTDAKADLEGSRWVQVGICGQENLGCWLDTRSVKDVIEFGNLEEEALNETTKNYLDVLRSEGNYLTEEEYRSLLKEVEEIENREKVILLSEGLAKVFLNSETAYLTFLRGNAYSGLARNSYIEYLANFYAISPDSEEVCDPEEEICDSEEEISGEVSVTDLQLALEEVRKLEGDYSDTSPDYVGLGIGWEEFQDLSLAEVEEMYPNLEISTYNRRFVDKIFNQGILTQEEYREINGKGLFNFEEDMRYVEELIEEKFLAEGGNLGDLVDIPGGETCERIEVLDGLSGNVFQKVVQAVESFEGRIVPEDVAKNCYEPMRYIYESAGVSDNCIYSDEAEKEYSVSGGSFETGLQGGDSVFWVYPNGCSSVDLDENQKLNRLASGTLISYYFGQDAPHNAIFVGWENRVEGTATLFDWNGQLSEGQADSSGEVCTSEKFASGRNYCKTYRTYTADLSDDSHPVFVIWRPTD